MKRFTGSVLRNQGYYFRPSVTWSALSSGRIAFRFKLEGGSETCPRCGKVLSINRTVVMREKHSEWKSKEYDDGVFTDEMDKNETSKFFSSPGDL